MVEIKNITKFSKAMDELMEFFEIPEDLLRKYALKVQEYPRENKSCFQILDEAIGDTKLNQRQLAGIAMFVGAFSNTNIKPKEQHVGRGG